MMKYILKETFDNYLRLNDAYNEFYETMNDICKDIDMGSVDEIVYTQVIDLYDLKMYFQVKTIVKQRLYKRYFKITKVAELTLDEFIEDRITNDSEYVRYSEELKKILK